jgi:ribosome-binding factor A
VSIRTQRIAEQVRGEIARVLREESHDPRIGLLTITRVKLSPDLSTAVVFWSALDVQGETDLEKLAEGLESASGFVRGQLARRLSLRRTPALQFKHDGSIEEGSRILSLIRTLPEVSGSQDSAESALESGEATPSDDEEGHHGETE